MSLKVITNKEEDGGEAMGLRGIECNLPFQLKWRAISDIVL